MTFKLTGCQRGAEGFLAQRMLSWEIYRGALFASAPSQDMANEEKHPDSWPEGLHPKSPPYSLHSGLELTKTPAVSNHKLVILTVGAIAALSISIVGILVATFLGRTSCLQRGAIAYPAQVNVQNEASLLLALSELDEQGLSPGITCDLRNRLMVYHGQPEGCVTRKMDPSELLPSCQELESFFQAVLKNVTLGITAEVQMMGTGALGGLVTLLCSNKPTYLVGSSALASPRTRAT
ncbi:uncharacterized protein LOC131186427 isoform X1 [Ahaetulla prasina]|uniref:uncharacterized protein LOC131186427 isoform X1 n=3 Tax=Ahaetulla prasina TaxID=499056 RepID=UPI002648E74C|nr:uncharacterized protein LOC131186427 isoform X1 [Ahaetulla prasina]